MKQKLPIDGLYPDLHKSEEVQKSVKKSEAYKELSKQEKSQLLTKNNDKYRKERTDLHLERYAKLFDSSRDGNDVDRTQRNIERLRRAAYERYVIKEEDISDKVFELEQQIALERGHGHVEITEEYKHQKAEQIINDQKQSLDTWINYLTRSDAQFYEPWFKYYAFDSITKMGKLDKANGTYKQRRIGDGTISPFPELNSEALATVESLLKEQFASGEETLLNQITNEDQEVLQKLKDLLKRGNFRKLYPLVQKKLQENQDIHKEQRENIQGSWTKYNQGTDEYITLQKSLQGYSTGWCTAGGEFAKNQLKTGDFYVFYSKNKEDKDTIPRIAIRMQGDEIAEIRGIDDKQELEPELIDTMEEKAKDLGGYEKYQKKVSDMRKLTEIYNKNNNKNLNKEELRFLYELEDSIEGFGYKKDPRVQKILDSRDLKKDIAAIFDHTFNEHQVTESSREFKEKYTKGIIPRFHFGDLDLSDFRNEYFDLPDYIHGSLYMNTITHSNQLRLPKYVKGSIIIPSLEYIENIIFQEEIGSLELESLKKVKNTTFPKKLTNGSLFLPDLLEIESVDFPEIIDGSLILSSLKSGKNLQLPKFIKGDLNLNGLKSAEGVDFNIDLQGDLNLDNIENTEGLRLPKTINHHLNLNGLKSCENLILPDRMLNSSCLELNKLESVNNLEFPNLIEGSLSLSRLISFKGASRLPVIGGSMNFESLESLENFPKLDIHNLTSFITITNIRYSVENLEKLSLPDGFRGTIQFADGDLDFD